MDIINEYYFPIIVHTYCRLKLIVKIFSKKLKGCVCYIFAGMIFE